MSYHMDKEVNSALIRLLDALCEFERASGRDSTLILVPHDGSEKVIVAQGGKPLPPPFTSNYVEQILEMALGARGELTA